MGSKNKIRCNCGKKALLVTGKEIYPHLPNLHHKKFWLCRGCDAYVGCHGDTNKPMGVLADKEHRDLKMRAHNAFDPLWVSMDMNRTEAYEWLAEKMGLSKRKCHIGMFNQDQCREVIYICGLATNLK